MASTITITVVLFFLVGHALLIESYRRWFLRVKIFTPSPGVDPSIFFTVIIPARNEESRIAACLQSILDQHYPAQLFEIIVADDYSTDNTTNIVLQYQQLNPTIRLLKLENVLQEKQLNSYKKKAIELAINEANGTWIVTTDADCIVTKDWLYNFANFIKKNNSVFVAGPVKLINNGSFVSIFQCLDFISLQGITAASVSAGIHSMCNGANLAYNKNVFYEVNGFKGIDEIASGDDMLLMHKIYSRYKTRVHYLFSKESTVETEPMKTWKAFFNQRIRWASKADKFKDKRIFFVLVFIYVFNLSFLILPFASFWIKNIVLYWLVTLIAKTLIEYRFMFSVAKFFQQEKLLWWFPLMQPFHIFYTIVAGWLGKFGKYTWKGRSVR